MGQDLGNQVPFYTNSVKMSLCSSGKRREEFFKVKERKGWRKIWERVPMASHLTGFVLQLSQGKGWRNQKLPHALLPLLRVRPPESGCGGATRLGQLPHLLVSAVTRKSARWQLPAFRLVGWATCSSASTLLSTWARSLWEILYHPKLIIK